MQKNTKDRAESLITKFKDYVYPYCGSGMLTNTFDDNVILANAKTCAIIAVNTILENKFLYEWQKQYWQEVLKEIKIYDFLERKS